MHQYWWASKSSSYFHSFCAALALSAHPIPLLPGTSGCLGFAANEIIRRTTTSPLLRITSVFKSHLLMSITWRKVLGTDPLAVGGTRLFRICEPGDIFWEKWPCGSIQRRWSTSCPCGAGCSTLWAWCMSLITDVSHAAGIHPIGALLKAS